MRTSARPEAMAVLAKGGIKDRLQHLQKRLLDQTIQNRRDAKLALATPRLGDRHPSYRTGPIRPQKQLLANNGPGGFEVLCGLVNVQSVNAACPLVGPHALERLLQVLS